MDKDMHHRHQAVPEGMDMLLVAVAELQVELVRQVAVAVAVAPLQ
jgi:hypothetical protein